MRSVTNVFIYEDKEKCFGEGPCRLLHGIERTGSLRAAAIEMNMSYSKAMTILSRAEKALKFPLTEKKIGGKGGGGSQLTPEAKDFLKKYEKYRDACCESNQRIFEEIFGKTVKPYIGCVIMASGISQRFGRNKLLECVQGKTLLERILEITDGSLFTKRVVVTRTKDVENICREKNIPVIYHNYPNRNDAVRLGAEYLKEMDGWVFCPCDQPLLKRESLEKLMKVENMQTDSIIRLHWKETMGTPIFFGKDYYAALCSLPEKKGGSYIVKQYPEKVRLVSVTDEKELWDLDTPEDLLRVFPEL